MRRMSESVVGYLDQTRDPRWAAITTLPLLLIYFAGGWHLGFVNVNGVDLITPFLLDQFGAIALLYLSAGLTLVAVGLAIWLKTTRASLKLELMAPVLGESLLYGAVMGAVILFLIKAALPLSVEAGPFASMSAIEKLVASCGAGFFEELVFRLLLLGGAHLLLTRGLGMRRALAWGLAVVGTSLVFSLMHYWGHETFALYSFLYRSLAGLYFAVLFALRGFAVVAWTHALYDMMVLFA